MITSQLRREMKLSWDALLLVASYIHWDSWDAFIRVSHQTALLSQDERLWRLRMMQDFPDCIIPSNERCYRFLQELKHHALNYHQYLDNTIQGMIGTESLIIQKFGYITSPLLEDENDLLLPLDFPLPVTVIAIKHKPDCDIYITAGSFNGMSFCVGMSLRCLYVTPIGDYHRMLNVIKEKIGRDKIIIPLSFVHAYPDLFVISE